MINKIANGIVIDSSAIIALLEQEDGYKAVEENLSNAIISTVNLSEIRVSTSRFLKPT
jgi:PIN domain nuclease of toxin-antitoxin system